jgi:polyisoprenoid-binding protein YceI|tara:strand:- start:468 stop:1043 length:576 start_codon:yes stop_codon:yes gene_type:complete
MNFFFIFLFFLTINFSLSTKVISKESWLLDKNLSSIEFELPVLFANNVQGKFEEINGIIEIDLANKENNKAIFSVKINSINMNYKKYKNLLLSDIFFDSYNFPVALVDTKKFSYKNENEFSLEVELTIKGKTEIVPLDIEIIHLANELIQIKTDLDFSRTLFNIGTGKWKSTAILKDKGVIKTNLFLFKQE